MILLDPDAVRYIILHCSASHYGDVKVIEDWHKQRGWSGCGYHWVVTNCYPERDNYVLKHPNIAFDGQIQRGRSEKFQGAHCLGHNHESIGVCIIGEGGEFSSRQLVSVAKLCKQIFVRFPNCVDVKGHYEFNDFKTCPELDMHWFNNYILSGVDYET
jgi:hypothetical protein